MVEQAALYQWTIYQDPDDFPGKWVVRRFAIYRGEVEADTEPLLVADSLDEARKIIPPGAYRLGRHPKDDPAIYEVWT